MAIALEPLYRKIEHLWTHQLWDDWAGTVADGYRFSPGIGPDRDLPATLSWSRGMFAGFPDLNQTLERVIQDGTVAVGVALCRGTHTGVLDLGLGRALQPTGRAVEFAYVKVLDFDPAGLVLRDRQYFDHVAFLRQLG